MAKLTKLERAKRQTRKKFRNILKRLPRLSRDGFLGMISAVSECGFCNEYQGESWGDCWTRCPFGVQCENMLVEFHKLEEIRWVLPEESGGGGPSKSIYLIRYWGKPAEKICKTVLREVNKVKE